MASNLPLRYKSAGDILYFNEISVEQAALIFSAVMDGVSQLAASNFINGWAFQCPPINKVNKV